MPLILSEPSVSVEERALISRFYDVLDDLVNEVFSGFRIEKKKGKYVEYYISKGAFEEPRISYEIQLNDFVDSTTDTVGYFYFPVSQFTRADAEQYLSLLIARISIYGSLSASYLFLGTTEPRRSTVGDVYSLETLIEGDILMMGMSKEDVVSATSTGSALVTVPHGTRVASEGKSKGIWVWILLIAMIVIMFFMMRW